MTALTRYERLEASGVWRAGADAQRRDVIVSVGDATLIISDLNDRALTHWSLAAIERGAATSDAALFHPDGDPGETLELAPSEHEMIEAIDTLRRAVARSRPQPGRLRWLSAAASAAAVLALGVFWLPGALVEHALRVVPGAKEQEIGAALLARVERVSGAPCRSASAQSALAALGARTGVDGLVVLSGGVRETLSLPGGTVLLNRSLVEDHEEPDVAAGYVLAEVVRSAETDPLRRLLEAVGVQAIARFLTTGALPPAALDRYVEAELAAEPRLVSDEALLTAFAEASVHSAPYAWARDISGETTLALIEADPMVGAEPDPIISDSDWLRLQAICEG